MSAKKLHIRLFLEGVEVPVIAASVSAGINQPTTAAIRVVATDEAYALLPRTLVHLFYYDDDGVALAADDPLAARYRLLFAGEYVGYQFSEASQGARTITLSCYDFSSYWDAAKMYFHNEDSISAKATVATKQAVFSGAQVYSHSRETGASGASSVYRIIRKSPTSLPGLRGVLGGLVHLLESIGGVHRGPKKFRGLNDFFSHAELRLRLVQMIGVVVEDDSSRRLLNSHVFRKWLKSTISQKNNEASFRTILELILGRIFHQYTSVPTPYFQEPVDRQVTVLVSKQDARRYNKAFAARAAHRLAELEADKDYIENGEEGTARGRAEALFARKRGPTDTVLEQERLEVETEYLTRKPDGNYSTATPSDTASSDAVPTDYLNLNSDGTDGNKPSSGTASPDAATEYLTINPDGTYSSDPPLGTVYEPPPGVVDADAAPAEDPLPAAVDYHMALGIEAEYRRSTWSVGVSVMPDEPEDPKQSHDPTFTPKDLAGTSAEVSDSLRQLDEAIEAYKKITKPAKIYVKQKRIIRVFARLLTHVFSPNLWYAPPPRCNVIFPDQYTSFAVGRTFLAEPTRLQLTSKKEYSRLDRAQTEAMIPQRKKSYWAPNIDDINGKVATASAKKSARLIMPHEVCGGIVPRFDFAPDIDSFASSERDQRRAGDGRQVRLPYMQRLAEYNFYDARFASRQGTLGMPFAPQVVPGFPTLIFSKILPSTTQEESKQPPRQYLALVHSVTHQITQGGGDTTLALSHVRTHREQSEFLGGPRSAKIVRVVGHKKKTRIEQRLVDSATGEFIEGEIKVGAKGKYGKIEAVEPVDQTSVFALSSPPANTSGNTPWSEDESAAATPTGFVLVRDFAVTEKVTIREKDEVLLPLEEVVRPPWAAPIYRNLNIGSKFYGRMIGCSSIIDPWDGPSRTEEEVVQEILEWEAAELEPDATESSRRQLDVSTMKQAPSHKQQPKPPPEPKQLDVSTMKQAPRIASVTSAQIISGDTITPKENADLEKQAEESRSLCATLASGATIAQSVERLLSVYVQTHKSSGSTAALAREYTWRPVATMQQIMGTSDLEFDVDGKVKQGIEGFHSRAYGDYAAMELLDDNDLSELGGVGVPKKVDPKADPRKLRLEQVRRFAESLSERAIRG